LHEDNAMADFGGHSESEWVLGSMAGRRVWIGGNNRDARRSVEKRMADFDVHRSPTGPLDLAIITPGSVDEAVYFLEKLRERLTDKSRVWVVHESFGDSSSDDWVRAAQRAGFQDGATNKLDNRWSALELILPDEPGPT
jgi:hypothetical protein